MEHFPIAEYCPSSGLDKVVYNRGISGTTTNQFLAEIDTVLFDLEPSKIFINIGTNDINPRSDGEYWQDHLLGQTTPKAMLLNRKLYLLSAVRLALIPAATLLVLWLLPVDTTIALVILTAACAPVGANVAVYAQVYGEDYPYACQAVALSTLLSVISIPLILALGGAVL